MSTTSEIMLRSALFMTERISQVSPPTTRWRKITAYPLALMGWGGLWGMIGVDKIGEIRRAYFEQHRSIKEIVR
ncbi:MAG TPA: hypothetical protein VK734_20155, partial [Bradyrhizobium sp.]|nr:hypothetical protein [Bradyrhizobium sp.]